MAQVSKRASDVTRSIGGSCCFVRSMASCGTGAPDALDCRAEKGEGQGASQPGHGAAV